MLVKDENGNDFHGHCWPGNSAYFDFLLPDTCDYWTSLFHFDSYKGSTKDLYTWNDMNEPSVFESAEITMPRANM